MNERIRELVGYVEKYISTTNFEGMPEDEMTYDEIFQKKFAELIVGECISTLEEKIYRSIDGDGDEIWVDLILKEHFGVEE